MPSRRFNKVCKHPSKAAPEGQPHLFLEAAAANDLFTARQLLDEGTDVNARDLNGWTALHHAAARGLKSMVIFLLQRNAHPGMCNADGHLPDAVAWKNGHHEVRKIIREAQKSRQTAAA